MRTILELFRSKNYRSYFAGQFISQIGNWMTQTATLWLVYQLTQSVLLVGTIGFALQIPTVVLSPLAGVWVDRLDRIRLLTLTQSLAATHSLVLALCVFAGIATFPLLVALAVVHGIINAFDLPARHAMNGMLAERREDLSSIISLNSTLVNMGRMVGPALAGAIIATFGAGYCFLLDAVSYLAAIAAVLSIRLAQPFKPRPRQTVRKEFAEGLTLAARSPRIRALLLVTATVSVFGLSVFTLLPAYAKEVFGGEGGTLGLLMSSFSTGAAASGLALASRGDRGDMGRVILRGLVLAGAALMLFAFSRILVLSVACLFVMGIGCVMVVACTNALIQSLVEEHQWGRMMSLYSVSFQGGMPVGALVTGSLAHHFGLSWVALLNGVVCLGVTTLLSSRLLELDEPREELREVLS